jgi:hypothetical protein
MNEATTTLTRADVLTHALAGQQGDEAHTQSMLNMVEDLLQSLQRPQSLEDREALRRNLPGLVARLQQGMASIALAIEQQEAIMKELMSIHGHHLRAAPKPASGQPDHAQDLVAQMRREMDDDELRAAQAPQHPAFGIDTNLGGLPTVPMSYGDDLDQEEHLPQTPAEWTQALEPGTWCKLFMQGQWATAQLLWVSDNREFFVFKRSMATLLQSTTRKALERLRAEGLATSLEERHLMQRAVDSMLQDLE